MGIAALIGDQRAFNILLDAGADPNFTSKAGISPLYLAIKGNNIGIVEILIKVPVPIYISSDPEKVDNSPVFFAVKTSNTEVLEVFMDNYAS